MQESFFSANARDTLRGIIDTALDAATTRELRKIAVLITGQTDLPAWDTRN